LVSAGHQAKPLNDFVDHFIDGLTVVLCAHAACELEELARCENIDKHVVLLDVRSKLGVVTLANDLIIDRNFAVRATTRHQECSLT